MFDLHFSTAITSFNPVVNHLGKQCSRDKAEDFKVQKCHKAVTLTPKYCIKFLPMLQFNDVFLHNQW